LNFIPKARNPFIPPFLALLATYFFLPPKNLICMGFKELFAHLITSMAGNSVENGTGFG